MQEMPTAPEQPGRFISVVRKIQAALSVGFESSRPRPPAVSELQTDDIPVIPDSPPTSPTKRFSRGDTAELARRREIADRGIEAGYIGQLSARGAAVRRLSNQG